MKNLKFKISALTIALVCVIYMGFISSDSALATTINLSNPRIEKDDTMQAGQRVTWDCIYFGSYPQSEVKESETVYKMLVSATGWDSNGDITINGEKYRRYMDSSLYRYFRFEPIKWRVLQIEGSEVFLLSDLVIDSEAYDYSYVNGVYLHMSLRKWRDTTARSWLNGYDSSTNHMGMDYTNNNFMDAAFTEIQQSAILNTTLKNPEGIYSENRYEGYDTVDKIFYLSEPEICGFEAVKYGFLCDYVGDSYDEYITTYDEARRGVGSEYANVKGLKYFEPYGYDNYYYYNDYCFWPSRSMTHLNWLPYLVWPAGNLANNAGIVDEWTLPYNTGVRPAMKIDLSAINDYSYAGTVCSSDYKARLRVDPLTITLSNTQYVYDGTSKTPMVTVKNGTAVLQNGTDYTVSYSDNVYAGIATVNVTGKGRYVGTKSITFNIIPNTITTLKQNGSYTTSSILMSWKGLVGVSGYEIYRATEIDGNYINIGTTQSLNFKDVKLESNMTYYYKVRAYKTVEKSNVYGDYSSIIAMHTAPSKVLSLAQKNVYSTTSITLYWNKMSEVSGYEIYRANSKKGAYSKVKTTTTTSFKNGKLKRGKTYYYKVRAYKTINGNKIYGKFSSIKAMGTKPKTPSIKVLSGNSKVKIVWKKISGISGYEVYMSTSKSGTFYKIKTSGSKNLAYLKNGLTSGKKYYFKVRSYRTVGGKRIYSGWSLIKFDKVK